MNLAEAMNRWGYTSGRRARDGGDFVQVGGNGGVHVNVHAGHGALLKSGEGFTPGQGSLRSVLFPPKN